MEKKLISLEEHDGKSALLSPFDWNNQKPILNGIACPKCGHELQDTKPHQTLASLPPKKDVGCSNKRCGYVGYRNA